MKSYLVFLKCDGLFTFWWNLWSLNKKPNPNLNLISCELFLNMRIFAVWKNKAKNWKISSNKFSLESLFYLFLKDNFYQVIYQEVQICWLNEKNKNPIEMHFFLSNCFAIGIEKLPNNSSKCTFLQTHQNGIPSENKQEIFAQYETLFLTQPHERLREFYSFTTIKLRNFTWGWVKNNIFYCALICQSFAQLLNFSSKKNSQRYVSTI